MTALNRRGPITIEFDVNETNEAGEVTNTTHHSYALKPEFEAVAAIETVLGKTIFEVCYLSASQHTTVMATALFHAIRNCHPKDAKHLKLADIGNALLDDMLTKEKPLFTSGLRYLNLFLPSRDETKDDETEKKPQGQ